MSHVHRQQRSKTPDITNFAPQVPCQISYLVCDGYTGLMNCSPSRRGLAYICGVQVENWFQRAHAGSTHRPCHVTNTGCMINACQSTIALTVSEQDAIELPADNHICSTSEFLLSGGPMVDKEAQ